MMAHRDCLHQARPIKVLVYRHRCNDWPLMTRLSIVARTTYIVHGEAGYTTAPVSSVRAIALVARLTAGRSPYTRF